MYLLKVICCYHRIFLIHSLIILSVVSLVPVASKADQTTEILIQAVNTMRAARGLSQLDPDPRLSKVAQQRISAPHFFQPSKDQHLSKLTHHFGFLFRWIGECQARGGKKALTTFRLWLNDPQCSQLLKYASASHLGIAHDRRGQVSRWVMVLAQSLDPLPKKSVLDKEIQEGLNAIRADFGLSLLYRDARLDSAARHHAHELMIRGLLSHESMDGSRLDDRVARTGFPFLSLAENLAQSTMTVNESLKGWMNSPGHRRNMLMPALDRFGFAVAAQGSERYWVLILALIAPHTSQMPGSP